MRPDYYAAVINRSVIAATAAVAVAGGSGNPDAGPSVTAAVATVATAVVGSPGHQGPVSTHNGLPGRRPESITGAGIATQAQAQGSGPSAATPQGGGTAGTGAVVGSGTRAVPQVAAPSPVVPVGGGHGSVGGVAGGGGGVGRKGGGGAVKQQGSVSGGASSKGKGGMSGDGKGAVIRMRGLPYRASKSEVMGFFKGCAIPEEGVAFVTRADGRVTGEAYVRFATREDAKMGIRKDREMMVSWLGGERRGKRGA